MFGSLEETITAPAAPCGGRRGIVRISGGVSLQVACRLIRSFPDDFDRTQTAILPVELTLYGRQRLLPALLYFWPAGHGFTAEESVEIHTFGSPAIVSRLVRELCAEQRVRPANHGEFTLRAFLNGRIDLTQAEAVLGVIDARSGGELSTALTQLSGHLARPLHALREELLNLLSDWEAGLDFAEEGIAFLTPETLADRLEELRKRLRKISDTLTSRSPRQTLGTVLLFGRPNAGKSTLFNALKGRFGGETTPNALVCDHAGTTSDWLEAPLCLGDRTVRLIDTAGTESIDRPEERTDRLLAGADLVLYCLPGDQIPEPIPPSLEPDRVILLQTKSDLALRSLSPEQTARFFRTLPVSSIRLESIEQAAGAIDAFFRTIPPGGAVPSTAQRCASALDAAQAALSRAVMSIGGDEVLTAAQMREALEQIGTVTGAVTTDDLLDRIFSRFCLGK